MIPTGRGRSFSAAVWALVALVAVFLFGII